MAFLVQCVQKEDDDGDQMSDVHDEHKTFNMASMMDLTETSHVVAEPSGPRILDFHSVLREVMRTAQPPIAPDTDLELIDEARLKALCATAGEHYAMMILHPDLAPRACTRPLKLTQSKTVEATVGEGKKLLEKLPAMGHAGWLDFATKIDRVKEVSTITLH